MRGSVGWRTDFQCQTTVTQRVNFLWSATLQSSQVFSLFLVRLIMVTGKHILPLSRQTGCSKWTQTSGQFCCGCIITCRLYIRLIKGWFYILKCCLGNRTSQYWQGPVLVPVIRKVFWQISSHRSCTVQLLHEQQFFSFSFNLNLLSNVVLRHVSGTSSDFRVIFSCGFENISTCFCIEMWSRRVIKLNCWSALIECFFHLPHLWIFGKISEYLCPSDRCWT